MPDPKLTWHGLLVSIQPRIRLMRSFAERSHAYPGYVLRIRGRLGSETRDFTVAIGKAAHAKYQFRAADSVRGCGVAVPEERAEAETADVYKVSAIQILARPSADAAKGPPFLGVPPELEVYRARGHRRLSSKTFAETCGPCIWGCEMPVDIIIDNWDPSQRSHRRETFCYGPKSCPVYAPGPKRQVTGRNGLKYTEEDWIDDEATAHRGPDD